MIERYTRPVLADLWSDARRYETWLAVELAACEAMETGRPRPRGHRRRRPRSGPTASWIPARILEIETRTRHDVIAFLTHVEELAGEPARWLHLGMTSSDVLDASLAILLREAADEILAGIDLLRAALAARARGAPEHADDRPLARHPRRADHRRAGVRRLLQRGEAGAARRWSQARDEIAVGKIAGAVGTYANLDPAIERAALATLGLRPRRCPPRSWPAIATPATSPRWRGWGPRSSGMALTVRHWQRTEVGEAMEAFGKGQKGCSAMPHKKNPILSENLCGLARLLRHYAGAALENVALWHERDISHSSVERVIGPDATATADFMVRRAASLVEGLVVNADRMRENLELTGGLFFSEAVLLALVGKGMARQAAYELVQKHALAASANIGRRAVDPGTSFRERLAADPEVAGKLSAEELDRCFDLEHHLRFTGEIVDRALRAP